MNMLCTVGIKPFAVAKKQSDIEKTWRNMACTCVSLSWSARSVEETQAHGLQVPHME